MSWLTDVQADARLIPGDEWDKVYWGKVVHRREELERRARGFAEILDIYTLEKLRFLALGAIFGTQPFDDLPVYERALAIARERKAGTA